MPKKKVKMKKEHAFSGADLIAAAAEGLAALHASGMADLRTVTVELPEPAKELRPGQIREIRAKIGASQTVFARLLNVPRGTAIAWETGARRPSGAALKLLHIARRKPEALLET